MTVESIGLTLGLVTVGSIGLTLELVMVGSIGLTLGLEAVVSIGLTLRLVTVGSIGLTLGLVTENVESKIVNCVDGIAIVVGLIVEENLKDVIVNEYVVHIYEGDTET